MPRSSQHLFRTPFGDFFRPAAVVALLLALPAAPAAAADAGRFLEVEQWDATFTMTAGGSHSSGSFRRNVRLEASSRGPLTPLWQSGQRTSWRGRPVENTGSALEEQTTYAQSEKYEGSGNSRPDTSQHGLGQVTIDAAAGTYTMTMFSTVIRATYTVTANGRTETEEDDYHVTRGQSQEFFFKKYRLPSTGLVLEGTEVVEGEGYLSELGDIPKAKWVLTWRLVPRVSRPDIEIQSISTPATDDGRHTFVSTDRIQVQARVSGVRAEEQATVLWTVSGREAAAPVTGFPRSWVTPVTGGAAVFQFTPADNTRLQENRRRLWAVGGRAPNPPLAFEVTAQLMVGGKLRDTATVSPQELRQDTRDILRQEYVDFKQIAPRVVVPPREEVGPPDPTASFPGDAFNTGNYRAPAAVRNGAMQQLAQGTQVAFTGTLRINSAYRNPRRNAAVKGRPTSRHMYGDAVDLEPIGEEDMSPVERRRAYLALYRAALGAGADRVLLERGPDQLLPSNYVIPTPGPGNPDRDGDGIPERARVRMKGKQVKVQAMFDRASHVHLEKRAD